MTSREIVKLAGKCGTVLFVTGLFLIFYQKNPVITSWFGCLLLGGWTTTFLISKVLRIQSWLYIVFAASVLLAPWAILAAYLTHEFGGMFGVFYCMSILFVLFYLNNSSQSKNV